MTKTHISKILVQVLFTSVKKFSIKSSFEIIRVKKSVKSDISQMLV